jgi:hypothetical protein
MNIAEIKREKDVTEAHMNREVMLSWVTTMV